MEKTEIAELLRPFALSAQTAKAATNRISSALEKTGSPAQLLSSVALSMGGLRGKVDEESTDFGGVYALESAFLFATAISKKGSEKPKKTREIWADTQEEAQAIAEAKASAKPSKPKKVEAPTRKALDLDEVARVLAEIMAGR
jgi:hypothetical protein